MGNWSAHASIDQANILTDVSLEEAEYAQEVIAQLFHDLQVVPARVKDISQLIETKKQSAQPTMPSSAP